MNIFKQKLFDYRASLFSWFKRVENILALSIVLMTFILHLVIVNDVSWHIYDEGHYVGEANLLLTIHDHEIPERYWVILENDTAYKTVEKYVEEGYTQHMPLSKLFIVLGILIFGEGSFGWRIFPILFGTVAVVLFYLICQNLTSKRWVPLIATFILAFENMFFILSGIAMLEIFSFTFVLAAILLYLRNRYVFAAIALALAATCKLTGALAGGIILIHWFFMRRSEKIAAIRFLVVAPLAFLILLPIFDYCAIKELIWPWDRIDYMFTIHSGGSYSDFPGDMMVTIRNAVRPWQWIFSNEYHEIYPTPPTHQPIYLLNMSWTLWALIIPSMAYMAYEVIRDRKNTICMVSLTWFLVYFLFWLVLYLLFDRITWRYHYNLLIPAVALALGYIMNKIISLAPLISGNRIIQWGIIAVPFGWMIAHFVVFWIMTPIIY